jgi:hypothetical protein
MDKEPKHREPDQSSDPGAAQIRGKRVDSLTPADVFELIPNLTLEEIQILERYARTKYPGQFSKMNMTPAHLEWFGSHFKQAVRQGIKLFGKVHQDECAAYMMGFVSGAYCAFFNTQATDGMTSDEVHCIISTLSSKEDHGPASSKS